MSTLPPNLAVSPTQVLTQGWGVRATQIDEITQGLNGRKWLVQGEGFDGVLKLVPAYDAKAFKAGLEVSRAVEARGLRAGSPYPTTEGELCLHGRRHIAALLRMVPGRPVDWRSPPQLARAGRCLAHAHAALASVDAIPPGVPSWPWEWIYPTTDSARVAPWLAGVVDEVMATAEAATEGFGRAPQLLHGDPGPDAILLADDREGLVDWGATVIAPRVYDLAGACVLITLAAAAKGMPDVETDPLIEGYRKVAGLTTAERTALPVFAALRWAAHARYASSRVAQAEAKGNTVDPRHVALLAEARTIIGDAL